MLTINENDENRDYKFIVVKKNTRIGATTSLCLNAQETHLFLETQNSHNRVILAEPTNEIAIKTFKKIVSLSETKEFTNKEWNNKILKRPIFGAILGSNLKLCLKLANKQRDLSEKCNPNELAMKNEAPFLLKQTCFKQGKNGCNSYCKYWNCIQIGYNYSEGKKTPLSEPILPNKIIEDNKEYYSLKHRPICPLATIYRHLITDSINIQISNDDKIEIESLNQNDLIISRQEAQLLFNDGFIPRSNPYLDNENKRHDSSYYDQQGFIIPNKSDGNFSICDKNGLLLDNVKTILNVDLKKYDIIVMTYAKIHSLYQSINEKQHSVNEELWNLLRDEMDMLILDEISNLITKSPFQVDLYSRITQKDKTKTPIEYKLFESVEKEIQKINQIEFDNDSTKKNESIRLFETLFQFMNRKYALIFTPDTILNDLDDIEEKEKIRRINNIHNSRIKMKQLAREIESDSKYIKNEEERKIIFDKIERYQKLMKEITINPDEIGIVDEILEDFDDQLNFENKKLGKFRGYAPNSFRIHRFANYSQNIFESCFKHDYNRLKPKPNKRKMTFDHFIQTSFIKMLSYLDSLAKKHPKIHLKHLYEMLLLSIEDSFMISRTDTHTKTTITAYSHTDYDAIISLMQDMSKNQYPKTPVIITDAVLPPTDLEEIFKMKVIEMNWGDPLNLTKKLTIISDTQDINSTDLYIPNLAEPTIIKLKNKKNLDFTDFNHYYRISNEEYIDISAYLPLLRLSIFINELELKYKASNIYIIAPNKEIYNIIREGMNKGIELHEHLISWLSKYYFNEFSLYLDCDWIIRESIPDQPDHYIYRFKISPIGFKGDNSDGQFQYYRGDQTIGVESNCRVMLAITPPNSPDNSFDWLAHDFKQKQLYRNEGVETVSQKLRSWDMLSSFYQTISRVKDPLGKENSIVFAWGITEETAERLVSIPDQSHPKIFSITRPYNKEKYFLTNEMGMLKLAECLEKDEDSILIDCSNKKLEENPEETLKSLYLKAGITIEQLNGFINNPESKICIDSRMFDEIPALKQLSKFGIFKDKIYITDRADILINPLNSESLPYLEKIYENLVKKTANKMTDKQLSLEKITKEIIEKEFWFSLEELSPIQVDGRRIYQKQLQKIMERFNPDHLYHFNLLKKENMLRIADFRTPDVFFIQKSDLSKTEFMGIIKEIQNET